MVSPKPKTLPVSFSQRIKNIIADQQRNNARHHTGGDGDRSGPVEAEQLVNDAAETGKCQTFKNKIFDSVFVHFSINNRYIFLFGMILSTPALFLLQQSPPFFDERLTADWLNFSISANSIVHVPIHSILYAQKQTKDLASEN